MNRPTTRQLRRGLTAAACLLTAVIAMMILLVTLTAFCMQGAVSDGVLATEDISAAALAERYDCILVLGAGLQSDGTPSHMLADRVTTACNLYDPANPLPIIMSGDHSGSYDEVTAMKDLAITLGVDSADIFLDHEGYSTYESVYRAKEMFGARRVLIVTQEYHLYRALFIARNLDMEADGVAADLRPYRKATRRHLREYLARYKDMFLALRGDPLGDVDAFVDLSGNGDDT